MVVSTTPVHATWFKNNIPLQDSADCRQIQEDKRFQLVVKVCFIFRNLKGEKQMFYLGSFC
jgi:hypothetical protein